MCGWEGATASKSGTSRSSAFFGSAAARSSLRWHFSYRSFLAENTPRPWFALCFVSAERRRDLEASQTLSLEYILDHERTGNDALGTTRHTRIERPATTVGEIVDNYADRFRNARNGCPDHSAAGLLRLKSDFYRVTGPFGSHHSERLFGILPANLR